MCACVDFLGQFPYKNLNSNFVLFRISISISISFSTALQTRSKRINENSLLLWFLFLLLFLLLHRKSRNDFKVFQLQLKKPRESSAGRTFSNHKWHVDKVLIHSDHFFPFRSLLLLLILFVLLARIAHFMCLTRIYGFLSINNLVFLLSWREKRKEWNFLYDKENAMNEKFLARQKFKRLMREQFS